MDVSDSFLSPEDVPEHLRLTDQESMDLSTWITELTDDYQSQAQAEDSEDASPSFQDADVQVFSQLAFQAGRVYQGGQESVDNSIYPINMDRSMLGLFIEFLAERAMVNPPE